MTLFASSKSTLLKSAYVFLKVSILKFLNTESSSRLKVTEFSFVIDLPSIDEMNSLFLKIISTKGTSSVNKNKFALEMRWDTLNIVRKIINVDVHRRYMEINSST
tara:strand:- start:143 stop:457 length:315 start_codon:yes stop_codon:yes gene_type:complete